MVRQLVLGQLEELIELHDPVVHGHDLALQRAEFRKLDVGVDDAVKRFEFNAFQLVLGNGYILLADDAAESRGLQAHEGLGRIHPRMNDLRCRLPVSRPVHFVLHRSKKLLRCFGIRRVVDTRRVDIQHLLVEAPLAGSATIRL